MNFDANTLIQALSTDEGVRQDPYEAYSRFRELGPLIKLSDRFAVATTYGAVSNVLRSPDMGKRLGDGDEGMRHFADKHYPASMLFQDPPTHTRLRRAVGRRFSPNGIKGYDFVISEKACELFEGYVSNSGGDLISEVALPLPVWIVGEILGVPRGDRPILQPWVSTAARSLDFNLSPAPELVEEVQRATASLLGYFTDLLTVHQAKLSPGLLLDLLDDEDPLSHEEIAVMAMLLFAAGFETTANLIGNVVSALLAFPGELRKLQDGDVDISQATEELTRYDSPVQIDGRVVQQDCALGGVELEKGTFVVALIGSANRDPAVFVRPEHLDLRAIRAPILSFGSGIHFCLGSQLARKEIGVFLSLLSGLRRIEEIRAIRKSSLTLRGFDSLVLEVR